MLHNFFPIRISASLTQFLAIGKDNEAAPLLSLIINTDQSSILFFIYSNTCILRKLYIFLVQVAYARLMLKHK